MKKHIISRSLLAMMALTAAGAAKGAAAELPFEPRQDQTIKGLSKQSADKLDSDLAEVETATPSEPLMKRATRLAEIYSSLGQNARSDRAWLAAINIAEKLQLDGEVSTLYLSWSYALPESDLGRVEILKKLAIFAAATPAQMMQRKTATTSLIVFYRKHNNAELARTLEEKLVSDIKVRQIPPAKRKTTPCLACGMG